MLSFRSIKELEMTEKLLTKSEVSKMLTLSKSTLERLIKKGRFPRPIKLSTHRVGWKESVVLAWIEFRAKAS